MRHATTFAVVPVKALGLAKRRLAPALPDAARRRLVLTMLEDMGGITRKGAKLTCNTEVLQNIAETE